MMTLKTNVVKPNALCWVVVVHRWGDPENHTYIVGVYSDCDLAERAGLDEEGDRGGKYKRAILPCYVDIDRFTSLHGGKDEER